MVAAIAQQLAVPCAVAGISAATRAPAPARAGLHRSPFFGASAPLQHVTRRVAVAAPRAVTARAAKAAGQQVQVDIEKPLGLELGQGSNGLTVKKATGNAAKAGISPGDTVIYTSSFFGDELWPADQLGFVRSALQAAPSPVTVVFVRGAFTGDVKRLNKKPAPSRFGRRLTAAQKARASHICLDCGYIYSDETPFDAMPASYVCPQCNAPKRRFAAFDADTGKIAGGKTLGGLDAGTTATLVGGLIGVGLLAYLGFSL
jgi:rubredoxin